jgi:phosphatidylinositol kinase/protein kinase (PI-3  family)
MFIFDYQLVEKHCLLLNDTHAAVVLLITSKNRIQTDTPIFNCISMLANAVGQALTKYMHELLELMFATGLSEPLRQSLTDLSSCIPPLLPIIQGTDSTCSLLLHLRCMPTRKG